MCDRIRELLAIISIINANPMPPRPQAKPFKPKCPELPKLKSYHFGAPDSYWDKFPSYRNMHSGEGFIAVLKC